MAEQNRLSQDGVVQDALILPARVTTEKYDAEDVGVDLWPVLKVAGLLMGIVALLGWFLT